MTDKEFDELHGGRELLPIEQLAYESEGAERFRKLHGNPFVQRKQSKQPETTS